MFDRLRKKKYKREFRVAVMTYLGEATYLAQPPNVRAHVDAEVARLLASAFDPPLVMEYFTNHWEVKAQMRARAMNKLGIQPLGDLTWKEYISKPFILPEINTLNQFRPFSDAASDAEQFLADRGVLVTKQHATQSVHDA